MKDISGKKENPFKYYDLLEDYPNLVIPKGICIPTTDDGAWDYLKEYRWVYNKLKMAISQGIESAPIKIAPKKFPVFVKPIYNFQGMGVGSKLISNPGEYEKQKNCRGYFWMEFLQGDHLSHDLIVVEGGIAFNLTFKGHSLGQGMFDFWEIIETPSSVLEYLSSWLKNHLSNYTGAINIETIGGKIIEVHLRMGDINALYNDGLMQNIVDIYAGKDWNFNEKIPPFYIFALWGDYDKKYYIQDEEAENICGELTYYQIDHPDGYMQNPPGGVRVALLCDYDKEKCIKARQKLYETISPTPRKPKNKKLI